MSPRCFNAKDAKEDFRRREVEVEKNLTRVLDCTQDRTFGRFFGLELMILPKCFNAKDAKEQRTQRKILGEGRVNMVNAVRSIVEKAEGMAGFGIYNI